jgi:hypothetical protein
MFAYNQHAPPLVKKLESAMPDMFRRVSRLLAATTLLVVGPAFVVLLPSSSTSESSCAALRQWARAYERKPPTLNEFASLDHKHRIAAFSAVPPDIRSRLWQEQIGRFGKQPDLTAKQRELLSEAATLMTPDLYRHDPAATEAFRKFWSRAEGSFQDSRGVRLWFDLGSVARTNSQAKASLFDRLTSPFRASAQDAFCECNVNYGWRECDSGFCPGGACSWWVGCGPGWGMACNGFCAQ